MYTNKLELIQIRLESSVNCVTVSKLVNNAHENRPFQFQKEIYFYYPHFMNLVKPWNTENEHQL